MFESLFKSGELVRPRENWHVISFDRSICERIQKGQNLIYICSRTTQSDISIEFIWLDSKGRLLIDPWRKDTPIDKSWKAEHFF